jgi:hypothetical protein
MYQEIEWTSRLEIMNLEDLKIKKPEWLDLRILSSNIKNLKLVCKSKKCRWKIEIIMHVISMKNLIGIFYFCTWVYRQIRTRVERKVTGEEDCRFLWLNWWDWLFWSELYAWMIRIEVLPTLFQKALSGIQSQIDESTNFLLQLFQDPNILSIYFRSFKQTKIQEFFIILQLQFVKLSDYMLHLLQKNLFLLLNHYFFSFLIYHFRLKFNLHLLIRVL